MSRKIALDQEILAEIHTYLCESFACSLESNALQDLDSEGYSVETLDAEDKEYLKTLLKYIIHIEKAFRKHQPKVLPNNLEKAYLKIKKRQKKIDSKLRNI